MSVTERLDAVRARIATACRAAGRPADSVTLRAVSKRHSTDAIREAYAAGQRDFAENYMQEMVEKAEALADLADLRWHFVGHLQRNKVKHLLQVGASVSTVDSERLINTLSSKAEAADTHIPILLQVNVGQEASKSGCSVEELPGLVALARAAPRLELRGLMTIPPVSDEEEVTRGYFRALRELAERLELTELSMGMSADLELAIAEGATIVRVGTAIFGPRA